MSKVTMTLGDFMQKEIVIPCYQRGYIWGKRHAEMGKDAVTYMLESLEKGFRNNESLFIQGITVVEKDDRYVIIDGQQRMTFFYLLLKTLGDERGFTIRYRSSRGEAAGGDMTPQQWLENYNMASGIPEREDPDDNFQDIYFFKKTSRIIAESELYKIAERRPDVCRYVKNKVEFLLISIDEQIAVRTFAMMNGNKAVMEGHELIKADLLRRASLGIGGYRGNASEWDNISLRSRYAHEWDRWLHWWNKKEVQLMYNCNNPMGWLLYCAFKIDPNKANLFSTYNNLEQEGKTESQKAKLMFAKLRMLQNKFEEAFTDVERYNALGIITYMLARKDIPSFINEYFSAKNKLPHDLKIIYNLLLCGMTYNEIIDKDVTAFEKKKTNLLDVLVNNPVYGKNNELAYRYLLILNVEADKQRKFNFSILDGNRSLEHIYPKSKIVHKLDEQWINHNGEPVPCLEGLKYEQETGWMKGDQPIEDEHIKGYITRESIQKAASIEEKLKDIANEMTEHSIGNLLLLFKNNNAEHKDKLPEIKRRDDFFDTSKPLFESRNLLHTLMSFGRYPHFGAPEIVQNQKEVLTDINERIEILTNYMKGE